MARMSAKPLSLPAVAHPLHFPDAEARLHGLDWLRAGATLLVVLLHAGIPYLTHPLPGLVWATTSPQRSGSVDLFCWWINGFIMPLFFLMSGYLAAQLRQRHGVHGFLRHRLTRIGGPLLVGAVLVLPLDLYVWLLGWVNSGWIAPNKLRSLKIDSPLGDTLWGVAHLWFLQYLLLYCLCGWGCCTLAEWMRRCRSPERPGLERNPTFSGHVPSLKKRLFEVGRLAAVLIAGIAVCAALLKLQPRIVIGFRHSWLPVWENAAYYAVPFAMGWFWFPRASRLISRRQGLWGVAAASGFFMVLLPRLRQHVLHESIPAHDPLVPILFATFGLLMSVSLFGTALAVRWNTPPQAVRYFCEASFWVYLVHHPLVALMHVDLALLDWPPLLEFLLSAAVPLLLALLSYEILVRRTLLGAVVNGRRTVRMLPLVLQPVKTSSRRPGESPSEAYSTDRSILT